MNDRLSEQLSAFADGESTDVSVRKLVDGICSDEQVRSKWHRYQVAKCIMKQEFPDKLDQTFLDRVSSALDEEPTVLAPQSAYESKLTKYGRQVVGMGIAASLVAAAILGVDQWLGNPINDGISNPAVASSKNSNIQTPRLAMESTKESKSISSTRVNPYLVDHSQYVSRVGMKPVERVLESGIKARQE